jgi:hypothetical protein
MKRVIADLMYQIMIEILSHMVQRIAEWLVALPWL